MMHTTPLQQRYDKATQLAVGTQEAHREAVCLRTSTNYSGGAVGMRGSPAQARTNQETEA
jgi:hypothetical protein